jgi:hypothetical protein
MNRFLLSLMAISLLLISIPCSSADMAYQHEITTEQMHFLWSMTPDALHIKLTSKTTSWVGIGFNPTREMKDANFIIGYVKDQTVTVKDQFGNSENSHAEDVNSGGKDNLTDISGKEADGVTEIAFTIPLNSGDKYDGVINPAEDVTVLLAYATGMDSFFTKHKYRVRLRVNLSSGKFSELKD